MESKLKLWALSINQSSPNNFQLYNELYNYLQYWIIIPWFISLKLYSKLMLFNVQTWPVPAAVLEVEGEVRDPDLSTSPPPSKGSPTTPEARSPVLPTEFHRLPSPGWRAALTRCSHVSSLYFSIVTRQETELKFYYNFIKTSLWVHSSQPVILTCHFQHNYLSP